jgi:hypothetical protein
VQLDQYHRARRYLKARQRSNREQNNSTFSGGATYPLTWQSVIKHEKCYGAAVGRRNLKIGEKLTRCLAQVLEDHLSRYLLRRKVEY